MLRRSRPTILVLLALSLLLLNGSFLAHAQAPVLYPGQWKSGIGLKNLTDAPNFVTVRFFSADTGVQQMYWYTTTLSSGAGLELYLPTDAPGLGTGAFSVEVESEGPVGVTANNTDYDANIADSYNGMPSASEFFVTGIYHNHSNWTSNLIVQNVNDSTINVSIQVAGDNIGVAPPTPVGPFTFGPVSIPAHASRSFDTGSDSPIDFASLGDHFRGSAKVTNTEGKPMAVVLFDTRVASGTTPPTQVVLSYRGLTTADDSDTFLAAPIVYSNFNGYRSGINIQNTDSTNPVDVQLVIKSSNTSQVVTSTKTLQPGRCYEWFLPGETFDGGVILPTQFVGAATAQVVAGSGKIVGTVLTTNYTKLKTLGSGTPGQGVALGYIMPSRASGKSVVSAPTAYKNFGTGVWKTGVTVSNVGTDAVTVDVAFSGLPYTITWYALAPGESHEFYLPNISDSDIPSGWMGSVLVTAHSSGTPKISGLVQSTNYGRGVAMCYGAPGN